nr:hypothetical protein MFLOJ_40070 [Mycobacterium florentinum]
MLFAALLESQVVVGADAGEHRYFLATQSGDSAAWTGRQTHVGGLHQTSAGAQKLRKGGFLGHGGQPAQDLRVGIGFVPSHLRISCFYPA